MLVVGEFEGGVECEFVVVGVLGECLLKCGEKGF